MYGRLVADDGTPENCPFGLPHLNGIDCRAPNIGMWLKYRIYYIRSINHRDNRISNKIFIIEVRLEFSDITSCNRTC